MIGLRVTLGIVAGLVIAGWIALLVIAGNFRRSFGASERPAAAVLGFALPVALLAVLFTLASAEPRWLLHAVAVVVGLAVLGFLWLLRKAPYLSACGLLYAAGWFAYYWNAIQGRVG